MLADDMMPKMKPAMESLQHLAEDTSDQARAVSKVAIRQIRLHPRTATLVALLAGFISGAAIGSAIMSWPVHSK